MKRIWEIFPKLSETVRKAHEDVRLYSHHDWLHAFRVGDTAYRIGLDEYGDDSKIASLSGIAGLCHNADRVLQKKLGVGRRDVPKEEVGGIIDSWLKNETGFPEGIHAGHLSDVKKAVLGHDGRNTENDSPVLVCLMDADRVVGCRPELVMRSAQHYHDLPTIDPIYFDEDPAAKYSDPKTVLKDIVMSSLELAEEDGPFSVRTRLGKRLINDPKIGAPFFLDYLALLKMSLERDGLQPWPFEVSPVQSDL